MIQADWHRQDKLVQTAESFAEATARQIAKTRLLRADLGAAHPADFLGAAARQLDEFARQSERPGLTLPERRALYLAVRRLKRRIALANPLLDFKELVFSKRVPSSYSHLVMQYFGWRARPGGGLFVLENPGRSLACRDVTGGKLAGGSVLEPRLSYDARRIVFSFVQVTGEEYDPAQLRNDRDAGFFHVWEVGVDGSGLRQLTFGPYDDLMPAYLPDGGIVFSSTRRRGYARCFGGQFSPRWHVYTLHRMDADGQNLQCLSFHDTNEWFPAVLPSGLIAYARWDYIDRDAVTHQNLWTTRPDGTNPMALWGNATPTPDCSFQVQPIPGTGKVVCTASAHHSITSGSIAVIDPAVARDGQQAVTRITPEIPFPEAEGMNIPEYYEAPWPLSEKYFLVGYSPTPLVWEPGANAAGAVGIYLLDGSGNRELIYRDPAIGSTNPCPLVPRPVPPVIPKKGSELSSRENRSDRTFGELVLIDVYRGLGSVPRGSIKGLRVVQIFPKTTHVAGSPPIGLAGEENGRAILGTVPVEPDGSARFLVPACKPILFQALDADGLAYQTMRTVTYLQPGETASCTGCHEDRMTAPLRPDVPAMALRRAPSRLDPGPMGGRPFSFVEMVQPVLDRHCVRCHAKGSGVASARQPPPTAAGGTAEATPDPFVAPDLSSAPEGAFTRSYLALCSDRNFWGEGTNPKNAAEALVPRFGARNQLQRTEPGGRYGARGSRLMALLRKGHYDAKLTAEDLRRLAAWIDMNAIFYGTNDPADQARQLRGEPVAMPEIQ
jgi:cytochrome c553